MEKHIEQYSLKRLAEVSSIYSPTGFTRLLREDIDNKTIICCPDTYIPGKMSVEPADVNDVIKKYAIVSTDVIEKYYLLGILNTAVSWIIMTGGKLETRSSITLSRLGNVKVRILPQTEQISVAYLFLLIRSLKKQTKQKGQDSYLEFWISTYDELLNSIALELISPQIFRQHEIDLLNPWNTLLSECIKEYSNLSLAEMHLIIKKELIEPQNSVIGNMKKLRVIMRTITEQMNKK